LCSSKAYRRIRVGVCWKRNRTWRILEMASIVFGDPRQPKAGQFNVWWSSCASSHQRLASFQASFSTIDRCCPNMTHLSDHSRQTSRGST
jgi:hypothetical protein